MSTPQSQHEHETRHNTRKWCDFYTRQNKRYINFVQTYVTDKR